MTGANPIARQGVLREIIQVESKDQISSALDGGSQNMAVILVWQLQGWNQRLMTVYQGIAPMGVHQRAGALQLLSGEIGPVPQHSPDPLFVNLIAPAGSVQICEC